jgi:hypothetical protein
LPKADGVARHLDVHASIALPNLDPAISWSRIENLPSPSLGNAVVAALDHFHFRDMTARIQQIASVVVHHDLDPPVFGTSKAKQTAAPKIYSGEERPNVSGVTAEPGNSPLVALSTGGAECDRASKSPAG